MGFRRFGVSGCFFRQPCVEVAGLLETCLDLPPSGKAGDRDGNKNESLQFHGDAEDSRRSRTSDRRLGSVICATSARTISGAGTVSDSMRNR